MKRALVACALATLFAGAAGADELVFQNGDRLTGKVVSMSKGKLEFDSALAGKVSVPWKDVASLVSETPVTVERQDESVIEGPLVATGAGEIAVKDATSGELRPVVLADTRSISTEPKVWSGDLVAGATIQRGNAEKTAAAVDARVVRRTKSDRLTFDASYGSSREQADGGEATTTRAEVLGGAQYDYFLTKRLYGLAQLRGEHDRVEGVDYRIISGLGLGYQFYETEDMALSLEAGPSYVYEKFEDGDTNSFLAARIAWNFEAVLVPNVSLFHRAQLLPSVTSIGDFLARTQTGLRAKILGGLFGEMKVLWDYNSDPSSDRKRQDVIYQLGIGYGF